MQYLTARCWKPYQEIQWPQEKCHALFSLWSGTQMYLHHMSWWAAGRIHWQNLPSHAHQIWWIQPALEPRKEIRKSHLDRKSVLCTAIVFYFITFYNWSEIIWIYRQEDHSEFWLVFFIMFVYPFTLHTINVCLYFVFLSVYLCN